MEAQMGAQREASWGGRADSRGTTSPWGKAVEMRAPALPPPWASWLDTQDPPTVAKVGGQHCAQ